MKFNIVVNGTNGSPSATQHHLAPLTRNYLRQQLRGVLANTYYNLCDHFGYVYKRRPRFLHTLMHSLFLSSPPSLFGIVTADLVNVRYVLNINDQHYRPPIALIAFLPTLF